jgi:hypothetical protein
MSAEHPNILYVGNEDEGQALLAAVEPRGWCVYLPEDTMEALGIYITYFPDVVVLDGQLRRAEEVYYHLSTLPGETVPMVLLTGNEGMGAWWDDPDVVRVARHLGHETLIDVIREMTQTGAAVW